MTKRGAGLHHIALCVDDVREFVAKVAGSGWLLHPESLETYAKNRQAWLCRPGFPCLIELNEASVAYTRAFVQEMSLSVPLALAPMLEHLGCAELRRGSEAGHSFVIGERRIWIT